MPSVALCVVANGDAYYRYASDLFRSAEGLFQPAETVTFHLLHGAPGWPDATMYRYHVVLKSVPNADYVFLCDADMLVVDRIGPEILTDGITATLHPGYVDEPRENFPYENDPDGACYVGPDAGSYYYCGGFVGGKREDFIHLALDIADLIQYDRDRGRVPRWHDESALNKILAYLPPKIALPPEYCYPQGDTWYRSFWKQRYTPRLMALDKTAEERGDR